MLGNKVGVQSKAIIRLSARASVSPFVTESTPLHERPRDLAQTTDVSSHPCIGHGLSTTGLSQRGPDVEHLFEALPNVGLTLSRYSSTMASGLSRRGVVEHRGRAVPVARYGASNVLLA